jgi:hypothetical protein
MAEEPQDNVNTTLPTPEPEPSPGPGGSGISIHKYEVPEGSSDQDPPLIQVREGDLYATGQAGDTEPEPTEMPDGSLERAESPDESVRHLGYSRNGIRIVYDPVESHAATHFADEPHLESIVERIIEQTEVSGESMGFETDMGEAVGNTDLVETDETDKIVYAKRPNRDTYMRFTQSQPPRLSSLVTVVLQRQSEDTYALFSAWIGPLTPAFPGTPREEEGSKAYWETHALAWGKQQVQEDTITNQRPW